MEEIQWKDRSSDVDTAIIPHDNDVLLGRGGKNNKHRGNEQLRSVARSYVHNYRMASKKGKSFISREIVTNTRKLDPPGRFLKRNDTNGKWEDVGDDIAREKASQAMRDAVSSQNAHFSNDHQYNRNSYGSLPIDGTGAPLTLRVPSLPSLENTEHYGHRPCHFPVSGEILQRRQSYPSASVIISPDRSKNWRRGYNGIQTQPPEVELSKRYESIFNHPDQIHHMHQQNNNEHPGKAPFAKQYKEFDKQVFEQKSQYRCHEDSKQQKSLLHYGEQVFHDQVKSSAQKNMTSTEVERSMHYHQDVTMETAKLPCSDDFDLFNGELLKTDLSVIGQSHSEGSSSSSQIS